MTDWLILSDFRDAAVQLKAGQVVDDALYPDFSELVTAGLAVVAYNAGTMAGIVAAFNAQRASAPPVLPPDLLATLIGGGVVPGVSGVPSTRNMIAGTGMTGGGTLAADRTFNVVANADGSIVANANDIQVGILATDAQHGARGGGTQHSVATTAVAGFQSAADKVRSDNTLGAMVAKAFADTPYALAAGVSGVEVTTTAGDVNITLPALAGVQGRKVVIVDAATDFAAHKCTLTPNGAEKINGVAAALDLTVDDTRILLVAGPTSWWVIGL